MADDQTDEILSRLRGISSDEKSEIGKMKCRIDDQARLIMMLKKRNDEYILANMALDKHSIELERQIEDLQKLRQKLTKTEHLLNEANQRFINEEERVNCDVRVEKLQLKLIESQQKIENIEQEFLGYKNYTTTLLNKEKHLNERLQQLISGKTS
ncbi:unnamed protein product [Rotaria magnacalcarata]|uniref:Uncharacterized protein n=1 Tax=Rotaria magnacalcarata TaxID=392030 RepID=A0A8S2N0P3_9BILA|nr:unnamed protein product [Rotaria magnacalcarata]CAF3970307.1 unnamed protein product [Rotaria magnacalcarata]CAF3976889.1 unnamed protein product [Rotaria magnacalcarata]